MALRCHDDVVRYTKCKNCGGRGYIVERPFAANPYSLENLSQCPNCLELRAAYVVAHVIAGIAVPDLVRVGPTFV
jgi:hypothetical protein